MLHPHPAVLSSLIEDYTALSPEDPASAQRREDLAYTLCVATGTRHVTAALEAAARFLAPPAAA